MRDITIILSSFVSYLSNEIKDNSETYKFDKNKSDENELKRIVIAINKSEKEHVYLITNKEDLFEYFNRNVICKRDRG